MCRIKHRMWYMGTLNCALRRDWAIDINIRRPLRRAAVALLTGASVPHWRGGALCYFWRRRRQINSEVGRIFVYKAHQILHVSLVHAKFGAVSKPILINVIERKRSV